jgi:hypothetical protein
VLASETMFVDGVVGFATGVDTSAHPNRDAIYATTDGGRTWVRRYTAP